MPSRNDRPSQRFVLIALASVLALGLAACSKKPPPPSTKVVNQPVHPTAVKRPAPAGVTPAPATAGAAAGAAPSADQLLGAKVKSALGDKGVDVRGIDVVSSRGTVTLFGTVDTRAQREEAGRAAAKVPGVKSVKNSLAVVSGS